MKRDTRNGIYPSSDYLLAVGNEGKVIEVCQSSHEIRRMTGYNHTP
jgi:hypothetical protein